MTTSEKYDVVVIGAGTAGLSIGYYLEKSGLNYLILEKEEVGYSWSSMPEKLVVLSPWWVNTLPGSSIGFKNPFCLVSKDFYSSYLRNYASNNSLNIRQKTTVSKMESSDEGFSIETTQGLIEAKMVVCASGYYSNPKIPQLPGGNDNSIQEIHAVEYYSAKKLRERFHDLNSVLLVGKRVTAGQLLVEISEAGLKMDISCRSDLEFRINYTFKGILKEYIYYFYENVLLFFQPHLRVNSYPNMDGGKTEELINSGSVGKKAGIQAISEGNVIFSDGEKKAYDLVIYATGYNPATGYLAISQVSYDDNAIPETSNLESNNCRNLFFLGLDNLVNFRSRYLRGIARDARALSRIIESRIDSMN